MIPLKNLIYFILLYCIVVSFHSNIVIVIEFDVAALHPLMNALNVYNKQTYMPLHDIDVHTVLLL